LKRRTFSYGKASIKRVMVRFKAVQQPSQVSRRKDGSNGESPLSAAGGVNTLLRKGEFWGGLATALFGPNLFPAARAHARSRIACFVQCRASWRRISRSLLWVKIRNLQWPKVWSASPAQKTAQVLIRELSRMVVNDWPSAYPENQIDPECAAPPHLPTFHLGPLTHF